MTELERAKLIAVASRGWERTLPEQGDVAAFRRGDYTIHLHGTRTVRLTGRGNALELSFHGVAAFVAGVS
jgi:hypothetical protein